VRALVIRGSGEQAGIDFERVHEELVGPALAEADIDESAAGETAEAGPGRDDMVRELGLADIVVADVSVPDANVSFGLGIRHAVRPGSTVLISGRADQTPFDLSTDRCLRYDPEAPGESRPQLAQMLRETLATEAAGSDGQAEPTGIGRTSPSTIATAFATHIAATQHQQIAASYAANADQLQRLIDGVNPKTATADQQAQFVADVERVLAVQNDGWVDLLGTTTKT